MLPPSTVRPAPSSSSLLSSLEELGDTTIYMSLKYEPSSEPLHLYGPPYTTRNPKSYNLLPLKTYNPTPQKPRKTYASGRHGWRGLCSLRSSLHTHPEILQSTTQTLHQKILLPRGPLTRMDTKKKINPFELSLLARQRLCRIQTSLQIGKVGD